jgi:DNA modification methylase
MRDELLETADYLGLLDAVVHGDCLDVLRDVPKDSVDLVVTSSPYADRRRNTYGGVAPEEYVAWFLPRAAELLRVLKPTGTFVLNIKEHVENGERQTYVMELVLALRKQGWLWTEEFVWHKKNCFPGKWRNRFRDAWEHVYQFNKSKTFAMYQDAVMIPTGEATLRRLRKLSNTDRRRDESKVGSGFGKNVSHWEGRELAYPTNVLHLATECGNTGHSAAFPESIPDWFIRLFTDEADWVLDPFNGSGTTTRAAQRLNRHYLGIDIDEDYCRLAERCLAAWREECLATTGW